MLAGKSSHFPGSCLAAHGCVSCLAHTCPSCHKTRKFEHAVEIAGFHVETLSTTFILTPAHPMHSCTLTHALHTHMQGKITIRAAYGAWRDLQVYNELGLQPDQIFIFNKGGKKQDSKKLTRDCQVSRSHSWHCIWGSNKGLYIDFKVCHSCSITQHTASLCTGFSTTTTQSIHICSMHDVLLNDFDLPTRHKVHPACVEGL